MPQRFSPTAVAHHSDLYNGRSRGQLHFVMHFTGEKRTVRVLSRQADAFSCSSCFLVNRSICHAMIGRRPPDTPRR
jgi:Domain of unknown function (DUF4193)